MAIWSFQYRITSFDGSVETGQASGFDTWEEMNANRLAMLRAAKWTPPKWWQWWRWRDFPRDLETAK